MADDTLWDMKPHTAMKHAILRRYLQGFYPKLSRWHDRIMVVDGFAGPGVYKGGEDGSPIVALDALEEHSDFANMGDCSFTFLFVEERKDRVDVLQGILDERGVVANVEPRVCHGTFESHVLGALAELRRQPGMPAFFMLDPFGVKGLPLRVLREIAEFPKAELLVSYMYQSTNRFRATPELQPHLDDFFGMREWRQAEQYKGDERKDFLRDLYERRLGSIGMEYVRMFEMRDELNQPEYFLAFATHSPHGLRVMEDSMWKADQSRGAEFSDFAAPSPLQGVLFPPEPDYANLETLLVGHFRGRRNVPIHEVNDFVLKRTDFRETHGRTALKKAAEESRVTVDRPLDKAPNYWGEGTTVTFLPPE
ncbi:MAG: three-Cys-motif partner protein TcmP [Dehalococcoidia bacterium]|nr:three-Cys-motif partner protein TcmP [Dehalococcoidia bacterium]MYI86284.1 three-Cys-motif partner protein TcmP [Dehalococcoidia bacterium]